MASITDSSDHRPITLARQYGGALASVPNGLKLLIAGCLAIAVPTLLFVARESWSTEQGGHGPIVMLTGLWLLFNRWPMARPLVRPASRSILSLLLIVLVPAFVVARITGIVEIEGYLMYALLVTALYSIIGATALGRLWFPLVYLAFMFPPPETIVYAATLPLKLYASQAAVWLLSAFGLPIGGSGVMIYIGQYELLVAAACSGLNSIITLSAISAFYVYVRHETNWLHCLLLGLFVVPVALLANLIRVLMLILLTYYFGEATAEGFLHNFAGIVMFAAALGFIIAIDWLLGRMVFRTAGAAAEPGR